MGSLWMCMIPGWQGEKQAFPGGQNGAATLRHFCWSRVRAFLLSSSLALIQPYQDAASIQPLPFS